jgi:hypothetical protein
VKVRPPIPPRALLTPLHVARYVELEKELNERWREGLGDQGVRWPTSRVQRAQLVGLYAHFAQPVDKDSLGHFVNAVAGGALDTQARHLRPLGWYVVGSGRGTAEERRLPNGQPMPRGTYALVSLVAPSPEFLRSDRLKRTGRAGAQDWADLCQIYRGRCAHCGKESRNPDRGHMDPTKPANLQNLLPLCVECNNWASDDVVFDAQGRVQTVLSSRFLRGADRPTLLKLRAWIDAELG